ncbi:MAG: NADH-quinone oxidoreductase subunit H [Candidatus Verstraetearchaeota archaeon]|nr:NADH-quinone oxidoreductase subunit H [Candidatus Verstraetearchaeota archaeon]
MELLIASIIAIIIAIPYSLIIPGIERKIQARIQQRIGPPILTPGFWAVLKFYYKKDVEPIAYLSKFYKSLIWIGIFTIIFLLLFSIPAWWGILGWASILGLVGLLKLEESLYVFMGSQSQSFLSTTMPVHDLAKGAKGIDIHREFLEQHSAERAIKMMAVGSLPLYIALLVPFAMAKSVMISEVVRFQNPEYFISMFSLPMRPILFSVPGLIATIVYFIGYVILLNEKPFSILKAKIDVIEGGVLEYAAKLRAGYYIMRNLLLFVLSSIFVTLFLGIPFDPLKPFYLLLNIILSLLMPIALSILVAFSPILTFRQIYPTTIGLSILAALALIISILGG